LLGSSKLGILASHNVTKASTLKPLVEQDLCVRLWTTIAGFDKYLVLSFHTSFPRIDELIPKSPRAEELPQNVPWIAHVLSKTKYLCNAENSMWACGLHTSNDQVNKIRHKPKKARVHRKVAIKIEGVNHSYQIGSFHIIHP